MQQIEQANAQAVDTMLSGDPVLIDVIPATQAIPELADEKLLSLIHI